MLLFARILTFLLHPIVLVSPAVYFITIASGYSSEIALFWSFLALGFVFIVSLYILAGVKIGFFSNFDVSKREQRVYVFPVIILAGITYLLSLILFNGPRALFFAIIYFVLSVVVLAVVTLKIKASVHVGGLTAAVVSGIYFFSDQFIYLLLLIPIMAWARVIERRHTLRETIAGFILGLLLALIGIFIVQYLI